MNTVESDECRCGTRRETIWYFLFHYTKWATYQADLINKTTNRLGDLFFFLGKRSQIRNKDRSQASDKKPWIPNIDIV